MKHIFNKYFDITVNKTFVKICLVEKLTLKLQQKITTITE